MSFWGEVEGRGFSHLKPSTKTQVTYSLIFGNCRITRSSSSQKTALHRLPLLNNTCLWLASLQPKTGDQSSSSISAKEPRTTKSASQRWQDGSYMQVKRKSPKLNVRAKKPLSALGPGARNTKCSGNGVSERLTLLNCPVNCKDRKSCVCRSSVLFLQLHLKTREEI